MHRSGTSLLGRLLEDLGLFVGTKKDENNEALFFLELNSWLMAQCGARWDNPEQLDYLWNPEVEPVLTVSKNYVSDLMKSPRAARYLGMKRYLSQHSIFAQSTPWGWKDPRNTFTLPFWLDLFPGARLVFIERHGVDVAQSLRVRADCSIASTQNRYSKLKPITWLIPKRGGFCDSPRSLSLEGGLSLWDTYQTRAQTQLDSVAQDRVFRVRYEDLLSEPLKILKDAAEFCGLSTSDQRVQEITRSIKPSRAYSYSKSQDLLEFAKTHQNTLAKWDYHA
tara:strand:+ start:166 stop:1002 length:837 start_codon:yes stop_codon:yes gene_type:complete